MPLVLKLGGSVLTRKDEPETVDEEALATVGEVVAAALGEDSPESPSAGDLVLVHGGGSFGHHHANRHAVTSTAGTRDAVAIAEIHGAMADLNTTVVGALQGNGVPAVPVAPLSAASRDADGTLDLAVDVVRTMLGEAFVPVLHGDVVAHQSEGATILSGDEVVVALATALEADRVGLCSAVPGVFDEAGEVVDRVESIDQIASALGGSDATDVTGGMAAKVRALLALDVPANVFGLPALASFLAGGDPGTSIGFTQ
ncbi:MAG: isopentenyl phosphate kinase [Haloarculaceae archaeon]